jgi:hypothetical protein
VAAVAPWRAARGQGSSRISTEHEGTEVMISRKRVVQVVALAAVVAPLAGIPASADSGRPPGKPICTNGPFGSDGKVWFEDGTEIPRCTGKFVKLNEKVGARKNASRECRTKVRRAEGKVRTASAMLNQAVAGGNAGRVDRKREKVTSARRALAEARGCLG